MRPYVSTCTLHWLIQSKLHKVSPTDNDEMYCTFSIYYCWLISICNLMKFRWWIRHTTENVNFLPMDETSGISPGEDAWNPLLMFLWPIINVSVPSCKVWVWGLRLLPDRLRTLIYNFWNTLINSYNYLIFWCWYCFITGEKFSHVWKIFPALAEKIAGSWLIHRPIHSLSLLPQGAAGAEGRRLVPEERHHERRHRVAADRPAQRVQDHADRDAGQVRGRTGPGVCREVPAAVLEEGAR